MMPTSYRDLFTAGLIVAQLLCVTGATPAQRKQPTRKNPSQERSLSGQDLARRILPAVVLIDCDDGKGNHSLGSGFFVAPGIIATNHHVVNDMIQGEAHTVLGGKTSRSWHIKAVTSYNEDSDLALLSVSVAETDKVLPLHLANARTVVGETIYAFGNPEGLAGTISPGIVSGLRSFKSGQMIQITAPISPGSSGGPIVNTRGEVIGIAEGSLSEGQNLNFAIPAHLLTSLLSRPQVAGDSDLDRIMAELGIDQPLPPSGWPKNRTPTAHDASEESQAKPQPSVVGALRPGESAEIASLRGLKDVYVVVETLSADAKGITTQQQIKTDTELQLRRYGIKVPNTLSLESCVLYLDVSVIKDECEGVNIYYYSIDLELQQEVVLKRDRAHSTLAPTWSKSSSGFAGEGVAASRLKVRIAELVDNFINDFLAAQQR